MSPMKIDMPWLAAQFYALNYEDRENARWVMTKAQRDELERKYASKIAAWNELFKFEQKKILEDRLFGLPVRIDNNALSIHLERIVPREQELIDRLERLERKPKKIKDGDIVIDETDRLFRYSDYYSALRPEDIGRKPQGKLRRVTIEEG